MLSRSAFKPRIEKSHRADEWKRCEPFLKWLRGRQCFLAIHAPHRHRCEGKVRAFTTMDALNNFEAEVAEIKAALEQADAETVEAIVADYKQHEGGFDEEQRKAVEIAISQARARVAEPVQ